MATRPLKTWHKHTAHTDRGRQISHTMKTAFIARVHNYRRSWLNQSGASVGKKHSRVVCVCVDTNTHKMLHSISLFLRRSLPVSSQQSTVSFNSDDGDPWASSSSSSSRSLFLDDISRKLSHSVFVDVPVFRSSSVRNSMRSKAGAGGKSPRMHLSPSRGGGAIWSMQPDEVDRVFQALRKGLTYVHCSRTWIL